MEKISALLRADRIKLSLESRTKNASVREVGALLRDTGAVMDFDVFMREVFDRERLANTALGHEVAIPHARTEQCQEIVIAVGRSLEGIDFEAKDGVPVRLIFLIGVPKRMITEYLKLASNLSRWLRDDDLRQRLLEADTPQRFIQAWVDIES
ncbi:MAG: PTS sugar transporter subunit IIA [Verrucomicrobiae bacterium]|nr:PTS sugar transporter subunit IIA [Verrucomicrobiae bacterium]